jgi:hypothetical protein
MKALSLSLMESLPQNETMPGAAIAIQTFFFFGFIKKGIILRSIVILEKA